MADGPPKLSSHAEVIVNITLRVMDGDADDNNEELS